MAKHAADIFTLNIHSGTNNSLFTVVYYPPLLSSWSLKLTSNISYISSKSLLLMLLLLVLLLLMLLLLMFFVRHNS